MQGVNHGIFYFPTIGKIYPETLQERHISVPNMRVCI